MYSRVTSAKKKAKMAGVMKGLSVFFVLVFLLEPGFSRVHNIELEHDFRNHIKISTFGILTKGKILIDVENLTFTQDKDAKIGFSVQKTYSVGMSTYMEGHSDTCLLKENMTNNLAFDLFIFDWWKRRISVIKCGNINPVIDVYMGDPNATTPIANVTQAGVKKRQTPSCKEVKSLPLIVHEMGGEYSSMTGVVVIHVEQKKDGGLYNIYFHNCQNPDADAYPVSLKLNVVELNDGNYLSAGESPLPMVFGFFAVVFLILTCVWFYVLKQYWSSTFKVHYLMFLLAMLKTLDVSLNAINYYYIGRDGTKAESWAVLHYIAHLLKGGLMFTTIILLGTGYFFIKHVLSGRDKKIFLIVIPLQIFDNIALIIMESTEEAQADYATWKNIFMMVDLICCGAVLFPVIGAIRHLKEASQTDGKAAVNLAKLKLFRQFYIMVVCYIYFTRIIVAIVKITVPFQYQWLDEFFMNLATFALFLLTGYKFRPGSDNPYLHVPQDDDEVEMDEVVTQTGLTENITRVQSNEAGGTVATARMKLSEA